MCTKENVNNATTVNNYNRVYVSKYTDCGLYDKYSAGSVDDIAFNMSSILNDFIEIDKAVKLIITFNVDYEGKDANGYDSMAYISISKNKTDNSFIVWISNTFRMECANYLPKVKEGLNNSGYNYTFKDENKIMSKKAKDSKKDIDIDGTGCEETNRLSTVNHNTITTSKYDDAHNINGNNPFTSIIGDVEVLEDDNIKDNLTRIELLDDIKGLIDGSKNSSNLLHYDAEIVTKIKEVLIACYERVEK